MVAYRIKYYLPALAYILLIFSLSSLNQATVANFSYGIEDFILHTIEYNILGVFLIWAILKDQDLQELRKSYRLAIAAGTSIAIVDEIYQSFVPSRFATIEDVVADSFGVILSILTFKLLLRSETINKWRTHA